jgi:DNA (cytosine-5)-methyltransferase 1
MKTYQPNEINYLNLQPEKFSSFKDSVGWKTGEKLCTIEVVDRGYKVNDPPSDLEEKNFTAIGFFSGAGGLDIGAQLAGARVIASTDFNEQSVKTLNSNNFFRSAKHLHEDIRNLSGKSFNKITQNSEKLILIGGPPCQPFSKAGYWVTHEKRLGQHDPRNMISEYLRMISEIQPNGFLLENVESLLHPKNREQVSILEENIDKLGYHFVRYLADARDFGVPQRRKRVFYIASKSKIAGLPQPTHSDAITAEILGLLPHERVVDWLWKFDNDHFREATESVVDKTYGFETSEIPPGENYFALTERENYPNPKFEPNKRFWNFLLKLHPLTPSWTIPAQPGPWVGPFHWTGRRLRIPEISAIQTFPTDYTFSGTRRDVQMQIGNAVPPLLAKAMVEFLLKSI